MMTYQEEKISDILEEVRPLTVMNHQDTDLFGEPLDVDMPVLLQMEEMGMVRVYTMRKSGELVGYYQVMIYMHLHHKTFLIANQDTIFIKKGHRGHASKFVQYCDGELKKLGVRVVLQHSPVTNDWRKVLERIGYSELQTTFQRRL